MLHLSYRVRNTHCNIIHYTVSFKRTSSDKNVEILWNVLLKLTRIIMVDWPKYQLDFTFFWTWRAWVGAPARHFGSDNLQGCSGITEPGFPPSSRPSFHELTHARLLDTSSRLSEMSKMAFDFVWHLTKNRIQRVAVIVQKVWLVRPARPTPYTY